MKHLLWIAVAAPMVAVSPCHAAGINLSWTDCSTNGAHAKTFGCSSNTGTETLVASFVAPAGVTEFNALSAVIDVETNSAVLPSWWMLQPMGCRSGRASGSADFTVGPFSCEDPWLGLASGGVSVQAEYPIPNRARFSFSFALSPPGRVALAPGTEYYAFKLIINNAKTVGTGACAGCEVGATMVLRYITLYQVPGSLGGDVTLFAVVSDNTAIWNGGDPNFPDAFTIATGPQISPNNPLALIIHEVDDEKASAC